ncbi:helix-turn-helix domain-containing protein [Flavobacterium soli]|uniref:helix-turn-helix domain-containing protein n=1 Tax=Flavobacterium soli TaxID=344881 RepID=UPI000A006B72|nr:helix-turn-helix domain-containing protein [Flavobacterium soli]
MVIIVSKYQIMLMLKRQFLIFFAFFISSQYFFAQKKAIAISGTLVNKDYEYLKNQISNSEKDSIKLGIHLDYFVKKARNENNLHELCHFYRYYHFYYPENKHFVYADSAIYYAKRIKDNALIGDAYYSKSVVYFFRKQYKESLDATLIANEYVEKTNDDYLKAKIKYRIANIKLYLGFYKDAIVLFKECESYFGQKKDYNNQKGYLKSLSGLAKCYISLGKYDQASTILLLGIKTAEEQNFDFDVQYFAKTQGINEYFKKNYEVAVSQLEQALPTIIENKDISAETTLYFYIGKSLLALHQQGKAMSYFFKVDSVLADETFMTPELRENFEILIDHYKKQNNIEKQLEYVNRLIDADKVLNQNYQYLSGKIHKEYDTKGLLEAKESLEAELSQEEAKSWIYIGFVALLVISLGSIVYLYFKKQRLYKQKFEALLLRQKEQVEVKETPKPIAKNIGINPEVVNNLLKKIERFEKEQLFLKKGITLNKLADQFKTNSTYLSKVINHYTGKNFSTYINDLRIEYAIDLLKSERITQKYSIKALGEMTGFTTTQHFSDAFQLYSGLKPSYFIDELAKSQLKVV